jgi:hypothetical protein
MKLHFNDNQIKLILYCLEQQAYEFNDDEKEDYNAILHSIEIAHDSTNYDF